MSLARLAVRIAAVHAIRGRTWAGACVHDSQIAPIDDTAADAEVPFVAVYTDDSLLDGAATDLMSNEGKLTLVFEIGVTTRMKPGADEWAIPTTDAGMEMTIDGISRQIVLALSAPDNPWGELFRTLAPDIVGRRMQRGASAQEGMRFAARQFTLDLETLREPTPGRAPSGVWQTFLALCAADPGLAPTVPTLTRLITGGVTDWSEMQRVRASWGLTAATAAALLVDRPSPAAADTISGITVETSVVPPTVDPLDINANLVPSQTPAP